MSVLLRDGGAGRPALYDAGTGKNETPADSRWPGSDASFSFSSNGSHVATASHGSAQVGLWDVTTGRYVGTVTSLPGYGAALGPDGSEAVTFAHPASAGARQLLLYRLP